MMQPGAGYQFTNVTSNPGDERTKKLYDLWDALSKAEQTWRAACKRKEEADRAANQASCDAGNSLTKLRAARHALDEAMNIPKEEPRRARVDG